MVENFCLMARMKHTKDQNLDMYREPRSVTIDLGKLYYRTTTLMITAARPAALIVTLTG